MSSANTLTIRRVLLPEQAAAFHERIPLADQACGEDVNINWFRLGTLGCTLVGKAEYDSILQRPGGDLWQKDINSVAEDLCSVMPDMPTGNDAIEVKVANIDFQGHGRNCFVSFILQSSDLMAENWWLREYLDGRNGTYTPRRPFEPVLPVGMIRAKQASDEVLDAVWNIARPTFTLQPPVPILG